MWFESFNFEPDPVELKQEDNWKERESNNNGNKDLEADNGNNFEWQNSDLISEIAEKADKNLLNLEEASLELIYEKYWAKLNSFNNDEKEKFATNLHDKLDWAYTIEEYAKIIEEVGKTIETSDWASAKIQENDLKNREEEAKKNAEKLAEIWISEEEINWNKTAEEIIEDYKESWNQTNEVALEKWLNEAFWYV